MSACAKLRCCKVSAFHAAASRTKSAEIILFRYNVAAVIPRSSFFNGLTKCNVRANAFSCAFFVIVTYKVFNATIYFRIGIAQFNKLYHLFLSCYRFAKNCDVFGVFAQNNFRNVPSASVFQFNLSRLIFSRVDSFNVFATNSREKK